jgi:hypothetical protein
MKKDMKIYLRGVLLLLAINFILFIASCDDGGSDTPTRTELISKTWKVNDGNVFIDGVKDLSQDYSALRFSFTKGGGYTFVADDTQSGSWVFNASETMILLDGGDDEEEILGVAKLTAGELHITFTIPKTFKDPEKTIRMELIPL